MNGKLNSNQSRGSDLMIALMAAGAFVGLFGMWVVLPRFILHK